MATDDTPPPKPAAPGGGPLRISGVPAPRSSPTPPGVGEARPQADLENTGEMPVVRNDLRKANRRTRVFAGVMVVLLGAFELISEVKLTDLLKLFRRTAPAAEATVAGLAGDEVVMVCRPLPRFERDGGR